MCIDAYAAQRGVLKLERLQRAQLEAALATAARLGGAGERGGSLRELCCWRWEDAQTTACFCNYQMPRVSKAEAGWAARCTTRGAHVAAVSKRAQITAVRGAAWRGAARRGEARRGSLVKRRVACKDVGVPCAGDCIEDSNAMVA